jgi:hypothetical protein
MGEQKELSFVVVAHQQVVYRFFNFVCNQNTGCYLTGAVACGANLAGYNVLLWPYTLTRYLHQAKFRDWKNSRLRTVFLHFLLDHLKMRWRFSGDFISMKSIHYDTTYIPESQLTGHFASSMVFTFSA